MNFDIKLLQRLLNHGKLMESGYPSGMDGNAPASVGSSAEHHQTNGYGDNPMVEPTFELEENTDEKGWFIVSVDSKKEPIEGPFSNEQDAIDAGYNTTQYKIAYGYVTDNKFNDTAINEAEVNTEITDDMITTMNAIVELRDIDMSAIAMGDFATNVDGSLRIDQDTYKTNEVRAWASKLSGSAMTASESATFIMQVMGQMAESFESQVNERLDSQLNEFRVDDAPLNARFTHMIDSLGNVVVRDSQLGTEVYLQGSDALELIGMIPDNASEGQLQHILSQYQHVMENSTELESDDEIDEDFMDSVRSTVVGDGMNDLISDVSKFDAKLKSMKQGAHKTGDAHAFFAFSHFEEQVQKLVDDMEEYVEQFIK